jgi:hypothetical protein
MKSRRAIPLALALSLALAAPAWAANHSGGVGQPTDKAGAGAAAGDPSAAGGTSASGGATTGPSMRSGPGGGAPAPIGVADDAQSAASPRAGAAQEPTPTTPEGGPQEPEPDVPSDDEGDQPADEGDDTGAEEPDQETIAPAPSDSGGDDGGSALGFLPHTGLELAAMAGFGLALVLMGTVLLRAARTRRPKALR